MDYNIISTGSQGNAVAINSAILIDCGVPFKALQGIHKDIKLVLLTHTHADHFNKITIRRLARERPTLRFGGCVWIAGYLVDLGVNTRNIDIFETEKMYKYTFAEVEAIPLVHNVPNCGYKIFMGGEKLIYATDTNSISHVQARNFDLYMLEANYSEATIVERIRDKQAQGLHCYEYDVLNNHLSKEKADNWLYENMGSNSSYIYMHQHKEV